MPAVPMYVAPPGYMEWTTDGQQANDLGTKLNDNTLLTGRCQIRGQMTLAEEGKPLGESAQGLSYHKEQDLEPVLAEPEVVIMEIKNLVYKALIQRQRKQTAITPLL